MCHRSGHINLPIEVLVMLFYIYFIGFLLYYPTAEFQIFKGQNIPHTIPFQMPWWTCSLTLDRVKCLHEPLAAASTDFEAFFYVHHVKPEDTYESIVRTLPLYVKNSKSIKGIVIICNQMKLNKMLWTTPFASDEEHLPLYIVQVEHRQWLFPEVRPQQLESVKADSLQPQGAGVHLDNPEALHIRFVPRSGGKLI